MLLPGEVSVAKAVEKSAEAIVGFGNELPENGGGLTDKPKGRTLNRSKCCKEAFCVSRI
jgi:hypothetical protein